jgi:hypothetical protein
MCLYLHMYLYLYIYTSIHLSLCVSILTSIYIYIYTCIYGISRYYTPFSDATTASVWPPPPTTPAIKDLLKTNISSLFVS